MPVPLWKQTRTRFYVKLLTTSNTIPTTTTAADDELDYIVRIRKGFLGFNFRQSTYSRFSFRHRVYKSTIQMLFRVPVLG